MPAVGPDRGVGQEPGRPVLDVENTPDTVLALVVPGVSSYICHQATAGESHLSSKSVVPLRDKPSSTRVRLDNLKYFQYYFHLYSLKGVKSFRLKV